MTTNIKPQDAYWQFGEYSTAAAIDYKKYEDGERIDASMNTAAIRELPDKVNPYTVLAALDEATHKVRFQIGNDILDKAQIKNKIAQGSISLTNAGNVKYNGRDLDLSQVGYEVHALLIEDLQKDIKEINALIVNMQKIENAILQNKTIQDKGEVKIDIFGDNAYKGEFWDDMRSQFPALDNNEITDFLMNSNNKYFLVTTEDNERSDIPIVNEDNKKEYHTFDSIYYSFHCNMRFTTNCVTNAIEELNNLVKSKTTQVEQLATDLQSNTSQYNSIMEAMSSYYQSFFEASRSLLTGA